MAQTYLAPGIRENMSRRQAEQSVSALYIYALVERYSMVDVFTYYLGMYHSFGICV